MPSCNVHLPSSSLAFKSSNNDECQRTAFTLTSTRSRVSSLSHHTDSRNCVRRLFGNAGASPAHSPSPSAAHDPRPSMTLKLDFAGCCWDLEGPGGQWKTCARVYLRAWSVQWRAADGRRRNASTRHSCTPSAHTGFRANGLPRKLLWARAVLVVYVTPHTFLHALESRRDPSRPPSPSFSAAHDPSSAVIRAGFGWVLRPTGRRAGRRVTLGLGKKSLWGAGQGGTEGGWAVADTSEMEKHGESQAHTAVFTALAWHHWTPRRFAPFLFSRRPPRILDSLWCKEDAPGGWPSLQGVDVWDLSALLLLRLRVCVDVRS
ncbi:hypothetical protein B0H14DRAFT_2596530 [Mycena olivaceomarginata]|nr:hypothetical protein B0H14DRAFT_2596530 [Mycena olivaceomarginata]